MMPSTWSKSRPKKSRSPFSTKHLRTLCRRSRWCPVALVVPTTRCRRRFLRYPPLYVLAVRWIIGAARAGKGKAMSVKLAGELVAASKNEGSAIKKKQDMHRMAEANRAFAHVARARTTTPNA